MSSASGWMMSQSVNRRVLSLALALVAVGGFFAAKAMFSAGSTEETAVQAPVTSAAASHAQRLEQTVRDQPDNADALTQLASAYLQRARETADPSFYPLADTAVQQALALQPDNPQALIAGAGLALARHDFSRALALGQRVEFVAPSIVATYAVEADALVELGRYGEAAAAAQRLADLHPDFAAYSRISYIRELHGDLDGAIAAMLQAVTAGSGIKQDVVWARVVLGNLYLMKGDVDGAERQYLRAAAVLPNDPQVHFGLSKLATARGDYGAADAHLRSAIDQRPLPEYVIALGDLLSAERREADASQQYDLVRAEEALFAANGVDTDLELALFDADHDAAPGRTFQRSLAAYERRPSIYAADTVAWAAYKAGRIDDARAYVQLARRLGTRDPRLAYHAGMIELASGDRAAAESDLGSALDAAAALSPAYVLDTRQALTQLH